MLPIFRYSISTQPSNPAQSNVPKISSYARSILGLSYTESIDLLLTLSGVGILARIFTNLLGDKFAGPFNLLIPACFISSILIYSWTAVSSTTDLYIWACLYGFFGAAIQGLFPYALSSLTTDLRKAGTRMGKVSSFISCFLLVEEILTLTDALSF